MDSKTKLVSKIIMSRRLLNFQKMLERTKTCSDALVLLQNQHHQLLEQLKLLLSISSNLTSETRVKWKMERTQSFWEITCQHADEATFKNNFRMGRSVFYKLCELLSSLRRENTNMREAIPLEKRIAIALYCLGSSAEYRTIANMFGVGKSTVCSILLTFCAEVWKVMAPLYLNHFPLSREEIEDLVHGFEAHGYPQCMGALDGCHIEIHPPNEDATDYYNYKGWHSIVLLALVDARCRFIYVSSGSPGRCNDSRIFETSSLKQQLNECELLNDLTRKISNVDVPVHIIGDSAFRLSDKLMKPYPFQISQSRKQKHFNYCLSKSRRVVGNAFGHLKARFRRIGKGIDNVLKNANAVILSCCVLHNFLNENNDAINENWLEALRTVEQKRTSPEYFEPLVDQANNPETIREAIASYLCLDEDGSGENGTMEVDGPGVVANMVVDGVGEVGEMGLVGIGEPGGDVTSIIEFIS